MRYNQIGKTYNTTRAADPRIVQQLIEHLDQLEGSVILDIGAGTGNYTWELEQHGFQMIAVEPSKIMREQARQHARIEWREGVAEKLPLMDRAVDGIICTLATHHFTDLAQSFTEMSRVLKSTGKVVIFTADPRICYDSCWIVDYFKPYVDESLEHQPPLEELVTLMQQHTKRTVKTAPFWLPYDLHDRFFFSGWRTPDAYLEPSFRSGISSLAKVSEPNLKPHLERLKEDLKNSKWHDKYGEILEEEAYDCGYVFLVG